MPGFLTTHVLDTARGQPAAGLAIQLYRIDGTSSDRLVEMTTNADGRTDSPILPEDRFIPGVYELIFLAGRYLIDSGADLPRPLFLDRIPIRFGMANGHYHVPLLLSPFGYSTYRGS